MSVPVNLMGIHPIVIALEESSGEHQNKLGFILWGLGMLVQKFTATD